MLETNNFRPKPTITTVEGDSDLGAVGPQTLVVPGIRHVRRVLIPAGVLLTSDRTRIDDAPDGVMNRLDDGLVAKVDGKVFVLEDQKTK